ncbi:MAG: hypothetical protein ACPL28_08905 [bacterium]
MKVFNISILTFSAIIFSFVCVIIALIWGIIISQETKMNEIFIYSIVIIPYLLLLLIIGIISGRKTKDTSDFYLGGRNIGPWVTSLSYVAAYFRVSRSGKSGNKKIREGLFG